MLSSFVSMQNMSPRSLLLHMHIKSSCQLLSVFATLYYQHNVTAVFSETSADRVKDFYFIHNHVGTDKLIRSHNL